jgi:SAM-dependent methyltransferase
VPQNINRIIDRWRLPKTDASLLDRIEKMVNPAILAGHFGKSATLRLLGWQYHLCGRRDTQELAELAQIEAADHVLDVCCFLGGPAAQLATDYGCWITGIDINSNYVAAAGRIAELADLEDSLYYRTADASAMPFPDNHFTVVWNQASLDDNPQWLREFDRVLQPGGRLAITFAIHRGNRRQNSPSWSLADVRDIIEGMGYAVFHCDDISERDRIDGWMALDAKLTANEAFYAKRLGKRSVDRAHREFEREIEEMALGVWGNGRIVAAKPDLEAQDDTL